MIPNYVYFGGVYLRYLWSGVNYIDSCRPPWNARVAHADESAQKLCWYCAVFLWLIFLIVYFMEKPGLYGLLRNLQLQENADVRYV